MSFKSKIKNLISFSSKKNTGSYAGPPVNQHLNPKSSSYIGYSGGHRSGGSKWRGGLSASGNSRIFNHSIMQQNSRDTLQDNVQARSLVTRFSQTVVGVGLKAEPAPKSSLLGITPERAEEWAEDVAERFDSWCNSKQQHRAENMNWYQSQALYAGWQQRDNDIFTRLYYSNDASLMSPLQFDFLDPNQIRGYGFTSTLYPLNIDDGIVRNSRGVETAYKVWLNNPAKPGELTQQTIPAKGSKSGRRFMLHGFQPEYAGQGRGYSLLAHAIQEFENLTDLSSSHIKKAINQSQFFMAVTNDQKDPSAPLEDILDDAAAGPASLAYGSDPIVPGGAQNVGEQESIYDYCEVPEATNSVPGSMAIMNMTRGDKVDMMNQTAPADSYDKFVDSFTSYVTASLGMPLEVLLWCITLVLASCADLASRNGCRFLQPNI
jgi:capsid protein